MENWVPPLCYGVNLSCGPTYFEEHKDGRRGAIYVVYIEKMRQKKERCGKADRRMDVFLVVKIQNITVFKGLIL